MSISVIICAAGNGTRIGQSKVLLDFNGELFINSIIKKMNVDPSKIIVVVKEEDCEVLLSKCPYPVHWIFNNNEESSMIDSIRLGLTKSEADIYCIHPVDYPFIKSETYQELFRFAFIHPDHIIKPRYQNQNGHPVIIPEHLRKIIINKNLSHYHLKDYIDDNKNLVQLLSVQDSGVLRNINRLSDLQISEREL